MGEQGLVIPPLEISRTELEVRFEALQNKLEPLWQTSREPGEVKHTIVCVPSVTTELDVPGAARQAYEERLLLLLQALRRPRTRVIYITSQSLRSSVVDYYLHLLPGVIPSQARERLHLVSPEDGSDQPLVHKLLQRPRLLRRIRDLIPDVDRAYMVPFVGSRHERDLALQLGIPMFAVDPRFADLGTRSGCRRLFRDAGVQCALGEEGVRGFDDIVGALTKLRSDRPRIRRVLVKLNEAEPGDGNATINLDGLPEPGDLAEPAALTRCVRAMRFEAKGMDLEGYLARLRQGGGIVEELVSGDALRSPCVQICVTPQGEVEVLSTHDPLLGGPGDESCVGHSAPADRAYAGLITDEARKVGACLADQGVVGRSAVDFVVVRDGEGVWRPYAIGWDLQVGAAAQPSLMFGALTGGVYDAEAGVFRAPNGKAKHCIATDHLAASRYRALTPDDLFDIANRHGFAYDHALQTGVVFHMVSAVAECGWLGLTAVGDSAEDARARYEQAVSVLDAEAESALTPAPLPGG
jgi:hypothetical protein